MQQLENKNKEALATEQDTLTGALLETTIDLERQERIKILKQNLPENHSPYTDKYFLRTNDILKSDQFNPTVLAQVFIRKGPGDAKGVDEAIAIIDKYGEITKNGGSIYAVEEGSKFDSKDTLILIEAKVQDIVELETMYLGVISKETTTQNDGTLSVDLEAAESKMARVVEAAKGKPVMYFGARHWHYNEDKAISAAAFAGGAVSCSTDIGAEMHGQLGIGTIPHALENIYAAHHGKENAVVEATLAFHKFMDPSIPRVALIDYNNKEITDAVATAQALEGHLSAIRVDTCGENIAEGALTGPDDPKAKLFTDAGIELPSLDDPDAKYWYGNGVTITGAIALRLELNRAGFQDLNTILTSGFGNVEKVEAFIRAEEKIGFEFFNELGVGGIYKSRTATMDIVGVIDDDGSVQPMSKVGRNFHPNPNLELVVGKESNRAEELTQLLEAV